MNNQPGKRFYLNHAESDSEYGGNFSASCNVKGAHQQLVSYDDCEKLLTIGEDSNQCSNYLN